MTAYGRGCEQDYPRAQNMLRTLSMDQAHPGAMRYLGIFATHGHGMKDDVSDYRAAIVWFDKCAKMDDGKFSVLCVKERDELRGAVKVSSEQRAASSEQRAASSERSERSEAS